MSSSNVMSEAANNKVLPGDKSGLPWELWQIIFSWLSAGDLCRVACVCKTWTELVSSVDSTRWKELYLACSEWRHPFWPLNTHAEPPSWRLAYRDQFISTKFWCHRRRHETKTMSCSFLFKKNILQRNIHVGPGLEHVSLKSALSVANDYDRIVVHPGIYDEQFEISAKIPFELIGHGELGSVILVVGIQQLSTTARLSNLVLRAPWFTSFIAIINSGYLQIDNCILEDGMICARNPSTVHIKFCTFRHASVVLQHMNTSIIENCEFSQSGSANIFIEGHPKDEKNWTYSFLRDRTHAIYQQKRSLHRKKHGLKATTSLTSTLHSSFTGKSLATGFSNQFGDSISRDPSYSFDDPGASFLNHNLLGPSYLGSDRDGMVGCGDLQSMYQESAPSDQQPPSSLVSGATSVKHKPDNSVYHKGEDTSGKENKVFENSNDPLPIQNSHLRHKMSGSSHECPILLDKHDILTDKSANVSQNIMRNNFRRKSIGSLSLQQLKEEKDTELDGATGFTADTHIKDAAVTDKDRHTGHKDTASTKSPKHSALRRNDRRKSVDSHVEFVLDDLEPHSHMTSVLWTKTDEFSASGAGNGNVPHTSSNKVHKGADLPPDAKGVRHKTTNRRKKISAPVDNVEHFESVRDGQSEGVHDTNGNNSATHNFHDVDKEFSAPAKKISSAGSDRAKLSLSDSLDGPNERKEHTNHGKGHNHGRKSAPQDSRHSQDILPLLQNPAFSTSAASYAALSTSSNHNLCCKSNNNNHDADTEISSVSVSSLASLASCEPGPSRLHSSQHGSDNINQAGVTASHRLGSGSQRQHRSNEQQHQNHRQSTNHHLGDQLNSQANVQPSLQPIPQPNPHPNERPMRRSQSDELLMESDDDLSILDELESSAVSSVAENDAHDSLSHSTDSSDLESIHFSCSDEDFSSSEESVIMLPHLKEFHMDELDQSTSPRGVEAEIASINSECTRPVPVNISEDTLMSSYVGQIQGCLIHQCRMNHSKGGLMISLQAHAIISECDISNVGYGIRCIQNSRVVILKNKIHHCRTSGIFMRLAASGLIAGNDIHSNNEAGIDIRKNADPLVQFNQIHHGKRSGVVVLGSGRGQIKKNDIYSNTEAGVYVLYGGNPTISENDIYEGRAAGVAINAGGKGCIVDNVIRANNWGGIDIRNGSCPLISGNSIINGASDGIVVGVGGKGSIENNFINGNAGCGIWMMAAKHLYIHGNQICNSGHCGVMMLDKATSSMEDRMGHLVTDVNHRTYSQYDEDFLVPEPSTNWAVLQYNNIFNNKGQGICIDIPEEVRMLYNAIHANQKDGILMSQNASAIVEGNSITNNNGSGIITSTHAETRLCGNGIYDNSQHGVVCRNQCVVDENDIVGHTLYSLMVEGKGQVQVTRNRLSSSSMAAIKVEELSVITVTNNKIFDRGGGEFSSNGRVTASDNFLVRPTVLTRKSSKHEFNKTEFLTDPPPRPHIPPPPPSTTIPTHHVTVVTKVTVPSGDTCKQGSRLCVIL